MYRCVLELHAIATKKVEDATGKFAVAMTRQQQFKFLKDITLVPNVKKYYDFLGGHTVPAQFSRQFWYFASLMLMHAQVQ